MKSLILALYTFLCLLTVSKSEDEPFATLNPDFSSALSALLPSDYELPENVYEVSTFLQFFEVHTFEKLYACSLCLVECFGSSPNC